MDSINNKILQSLNSDEAIEEFCDRIVHMKEVEDKFFDDMSKNLLKGIIYYLLSSVEEKDQTFEKALELLKESETNDDTSELKKRINELPYDHPAKMYFKSVDLLPERTYLTVVKSLERILEDLVQ